MIAEIQAGLAGAKAVIDTAKGLHSLTTEAAKNQAVIDIQRSALEAQQGLAAARDAHSASLKRIEELEAEITELKAWDGEKQRYELKRFHPGTLAYVLKPSSADGEPPHHLCANCYQHGHKALLQATLQVRMRRRIYVCPSCKSEYPIGEEMPASE